ncbi:hypothetical protein [Streptomyces jumonjinensis]|uniref:Uncharacterized protein n=1 Tax=Streptomyces jumonjinensis TaxID=1945 RepID=A0A646KR53_STRJU|nr:hypothetical protein [Streptomyces jumonjinensis]MQT04715.1 hypothetical protein [Streptomyces jumonjinensis]
MTPFAGLFYGVLWTVLGSLAAAQAEPVWLVVFGCVALLTGAHCLWWAHVLRRAGFGLFDCGYVDFDAKGSCRRCAGCGWVEGIRDGVRCPCVRRDPGPPEDDGRPPGRAPRAAPVGEDGTADAPREGRPGRGSPRRRH